METGPVQRFVPVMLVLCMTLTPAKVNANDVDKAGVLLTGALNVKYAGHLEKTDQDGRLLVWVGSIEGDFSGHISWWFVKPSPAASTEYVGGQVSYYKARWEISVDKKLVLAGESAGKTVTQNQSDGMWDGHGVVTEAYGKFAQLKGRKVYETGPVIFGANPPISLTSTGMFQIY